MGELTTSSKAIATEAGRTAPRRLLGAVPFVLACAALLSGTRAHGDATATVGGTAAIYGSIPPDQIETLSTSDRIQAATRSGSMMAIWETLEHAEKVECIECISAVEPLLYDANPRTREISAWWLRRRLFGVFGPGEVYARTIATLAGDPDAKRRAKAADALGEFLAAPGAEACAAAIASDADPDVRAAAARALGRLNDDGGGALSRAMGDGDPRVRTAATRAAGLVNAFSDLATVARLAADPDASVRRSAVELLGSRHAAKEGAAAIEARARSDPDANVRNAACHALGALHQLSSRAVLEAAAASDPDGLVRDQAKIALRRL